MKTTLLGITAFVLGVSVGHAQLHDSVREFFEAGDYASVLRTTTTLREQGSATAEDGYLEVQAFLRLEQRDNALQAAAGQAATPAAPWQQIAASAGALIDKDLARATALAEQAVAAAPNHFFAHYQLGLVRAEREEWTGAATAFERAAEIDPTFAYAHYYAGLAQSKVKRLDRTAREFGIFLKLAPEAPERPAVESIMRTLRGR